METNNEHTVKKSVTSRKRGEQELGPAREHSEDPTEEKRCAQTHRRKHSRQEGGGRRQQRHRSMSHEPRSHRHLLLRLKDKRGRDPATLEITKPLHCLLHQ